jgi:hypothetical protein
MWAAAVADSAAEAPVPGPVVRVLARLVHGLAARVLLVGSVVQAVPRQVHLLAQVPVVLLPVRLPVLVQGLPAREARARVPVALLALAVLVPAV